MPVLRKEHCTGIVKTLLLFKPNSLRYSTTRDGSRLQHNIGPDFKRVTPKSPGFKPFQAKIMTGNR